MFHGNFFSPVLQFDIDLSTQVYSLTQSPRSLPGETWQVKNVVKVAGEQGEIF
jgi:hypothetical protein